MADSRVSNLIYVESSSTISRPASIQNLLWLMLVLSGTIREYLLSLKICVCPASRQIEEGQRAFLSLLLLIRLELNNPSDFKATYSGLPQ